MSSCRATNAKSTSSKHYTGIVLGRMLEAVASIPFTWQDPRPLGGGQGPSVPHSAEVVPTHSGEAKSTSALVAQWIEQRFPNSEPAPPNTSVSRSPHNVTRDLGDDDESVSAEMRRAEKRAAQFDGRRHVKLGRREAVRRQRDDEVTRLMLEAKRVVLGDTTLPTKEARREHVYGLFARVAELRGGR